MVDYAVMEGRDKLADKMSAAIKYNIPQALRMYGLGYDIGTDYFTNFF